MQDLTGKYVCVDTGSVGLAGAGLVLCRSDYLLSLHALHSYSSAEERAAACETFARLNAAYEDLKARQDEEEFEMVMMGGNFGAGEGRSGQRRVKFTSSDKIRESNPDRVNYNRIDELRERKNLKATHWKDEGYQFNRHNGDFGPPRRW